MIIGCGRYRTFCFSRCTLVDWVIFLHFICLRPKGAAFGPASFDFDFRHHRHHFIWSFDLSIDFKSTSATRSGEGLYVTFNCWIGMPGEQ